MFCSSSYLLKWTKFFAIEYSKITNQISIDKKSMTCWITTTKTFQSFLSIKKNDLIFRLNDFSTNDHVYEFRRFCIFYFIVQEIFQLIHDDEYVDYVKCFEQMFVLYYIRDLFRYLRNYLKYCSKCQIYQIKRHAFYNSLQFILISLISFYTIIINFILISFISRDEFDITMFVIYKFTKRIIFIIDKKTWFVVEWKIVLIDKFDVAN